MQEVATGYGLIEGPVWEAGQGLYFSDVLNGGVYRLGLDDGVSEVIPRRRGGGGIVVSGRDVSYAPLSGAEGRVLLTPAQAAPDAIGFNDLTTDAQGRIYVGSLAFRVFGGDAPKPGHLHRINLDGSVE